MEVKTEDAEQAIAILQQEYLQSTGLASHDLSTAGAVFDENAVTTVCPACGTTFVPKETVTCPECELRFG
ncbi:hypothetical protein [Desulfosediminicola flagellatus]|uniref:hypothetical protein n=1 Tax=Desulfosediminicola flagellatus TaxID=2569541 RepID=UPI0010AC2EED|nr:hypothetical protein [Desulfosediminicola flagellatus]